MINLHGKGSTYSPNKVDGFAGVWIMQNPGSHQTPVVRLTCDVFEVAHQNVVAQIADMILVVDTAPTVRKLSSGITAVARPRLSLQAL